MRYCVPYYRTFRYKNYLDEVVLEYKNENIVDFVKDNYKPEQTVIVDITDVSTGQMDDVIPVLKMLQQEHEKLLIRTYATNYEKLREAGLRYFFWHLCYTLDSVYSFIEAGVTDVYIAGELGFSLESVGTYCHSRGVSVRVFPQMAQYLSEMPSCIPPLTKFFIRPEDTEIYEPYVDVFEFFSQTPDRYSVWFEIYKNRKWDGDLRALISGLDTTAPNNGIPTSFGKTRVKCGHKCMLGKCNICNICVQISGILHNNDLMVERKDNSWANNEN